MWLSTFSNVPSAVFEVLRWSHCDKLEATQAWNLCYNSLPVSCYFYLKEEPSVDEPHPCFGSKNNLKNMGLNRRTAQSSRAQVLCMNSKAFNLSHLRAFAACASDLCSVPIIHLAGYNQEMQFPNLATSDTFPYVRAKKKIIHIKEKFKTPLLFLNYCTG